MPGWVAAKSLTAMIETTWWERTRVSPASSTEAGPAPVKPRAPADSTPPPAEGPYRSARTGSVPLPPPPAWPYQTKVAPQSQARAPSPSGTGPQSQPKAKRAGSPQSAMPTSKTGIPVWWQPQAPAQPPVHAVPTKPTSSARRTAGALHHRRPDPVRRVPDRSTAHPRGNHWPGRSRHRVLARQEQPDETTRSASAQRHLPGA